MKRHRGTLNAYRQVKGDNSEKTTQVWLQLHRDSIETWAWGGPGGMLDKLTARMPPPHHPLHKNAEIANYDLSAVYFQTHVRTAVPNAHRWRFDTV